MISELTERSHHEDRQPTTETLARDHRCGWDQVAAIGQHKIISRHASKASHTVGTDEVRCCRGRQHHGRTRDHLPPQMVGRFG